MPSNASLDKGSPVFIATIVLSVLLAAAVLGSGGAKLAVAKQSIEIRDRLGIAAPLWRSIGVLEVAAAVGLAVGLAIPALGIAAAVGPVLLLIGAIATHARRTTCPTLPRPLGSSYWRSPQRSRGSPQAESGIGYG